MLNCQWGRLAGSPDKGGYRLLGFLSCRTEPPARRAAIPWLFFFSFFCWLFIEMVQLEESALLLFVGDEVRLL